jgi:hypothetical protein
MKRHIARLESRPFPADAPDLPSYSDRQAPPPSPDPGANADVNMAPRR